MQACTLRITTSLEDAGTNSLGGLPVPQNHQLAPTDTADAVVRMMLDQFRNEISALDWSYPESKGLSIYDAVNLASIVEKESSGDEQIRSQVAAVFYNRLSSSNKETFGFLQSDGPHAYEVGHDPSAEEVQADTPYSTYANPGLPPTPICSPGLDCLQAVCAPLRMITATIITSSSGRTTRVRRSMRSAKTYEEHQAAIAEHL